MRILIFLFILLPAIAVADPEITFKSPDALYIEVQKGISCQKQFTLQTEKLQIMESIIATLEKENTLSTEQLTILDKKVEALTLLKTSQDSSISELTNLVQTQKEGYEKIIAASKPTLWDKIKNNALWTGVGFIVGTVTTISLSN